MPNFVVFASVNYLRKNAQLLTLWRQADWKYKSSNMFVFEYDNDNCSCSCKVATWNIIK